jgi:hypothetical protein
MKFQWFFQSIFNGVKIAHRSAEWYWLCLDLGRFGTGRSNEEGA